MSQLYRKLISNLREWNNCFIKYQTMYRNNSNFFFYRLLFSASLREILCDKIVNNSVFGEAIGYRIYTVISREPITAFPNPALCATGAGEFFYAHFKMADCHGSFITRKVTS